MEQKPQQVKRTKSYVDRVYELVEQKPGVVDIIILNRFKNAVRTTLDYQTTIHYAGLYGVLLDKVQMGLQKIDPIEEVLMLRVRTTAHEMLITPDGPITVMVVQSAVDQFQQ